MQNFNYHSHTYRCRHADDTVLDEDYVKEYIKAGFKEIAFTDHVPQKNVIDTRKRMRMDYSEKEALFDTIFHFTDNIYSRSINIVHRFCLISWSITSKFTFIQCIDEMFDEFIRYSVFC